MIEISTCPICSRKLTFNKGSLFCPVADALDSHYWIETNGSEDFPGMHICGIEYRFENFRAFVDYHEKVTIFWEKEAGSVECPALNRINKLLSFEDLLRYDKAWVMN